MNFFKNKFYLSLTVGILSLALLVSILWAGGFIAGYTDREAAVSYTHLDVYKRQDSMLASSMT